LRTHIHTDTKRPSTPDIIKLAGLSGCRTLLIVNVSELSRPLITQKGKSSSLLQCPSAAEPLSLVLASYWPVYIPASLKTSSACSLCSGYVRVVRNEQRPAAHHTRNAAQLRFERLAQVRAGDRMCERQGSRLVRSR
jgi:hypothetical protein